LADEMDEWRQFVLVGRGAKATRRDWPWISYFDNDPEGQVYLETISRAAGQAAGFSAYGGKLVRPIQANDADHGRRSLMAIIRDVIAPIAENLIDVDEEIMRSVPRDNRSKARWTSRSFRSLFSTAKKQGWNVIDALTCDPANLAKSPHLS